MITKLPVILKRMVAPSSEFQESRMRIQDQSDNRQRLGAGLRCPLVAQRRRPFVRGTTGIRDAHNAGNGSG